MKIRPSLGGSTRGNPWESICGRSVVIRARARAMRDGPDKLSSVGSFNGTGSGKSKKRSSKVGKKSLEEVTEILKKSLQHQAVVSRDPDSVVDRNEDNSSRNQKLTIKSRRRKLDSKSELETEPKKIKNAKFQSRRTQGYDEDHSSCSSESAHIDHGQLMSKRRDFPIKNKDLPLPKKRPYNSRPENLTKLPVHKRGKTATSRKKSKGQVSGANAKTEMLHRWISDVRGGNSNNIDADTGGLNIQYVDIFKDIELRTRSPSEDRSIGISEIGDLKSINSNRPPVLRYAKQIAVGTGSDKNKKQPRKVGKKALEEVVEILKKSLQHQAVVSRDPDIVVDRNEDTSSRNQKLTIESRRRKLDSKSELETEPKKIRNAKFQSRRTQGYDEDHSSCSSESAHIDHGQLMSKRRDFPIENKDLPLPKKRAYNSRPENLTKLPVHKRGKTATSRKKSSGQVSGANAKTEMLHRWISDVREGNSNNIDADTGGLNIQYVDIFKDIELRTRSPSEDRSVGISEIGDLKSINSNRPPVLRYAKQIAVGTGSDKNKKQPRKVGKKALEEVVEILKKSLQHQAVVSRDPDIVVDRNEDNSSRNQKLTIESRRRKLDCKSKLETEPKKIRKFQSRRTQEYDEDHSCSSDSAHIDHGQLMSKRRDFPIENKDLPPPHERQTEPSNSKKNDSCSHRRTELKVVIQRIEADECVTSVETQEANPKKVGNGPGNIGIRRSKRSRRPPVPEVYPNLILVYTRRQLISTNKDLPSLADERCLTAWMPYSMRSRIRRAMKRPSVDLASASVRKTALATTSATHLPPGDTAPPKTAQRRTRKRVADNTVAGDICERLLPSHRAL